MLYVPLDTNWPDHPKIIRAGLEGAGLHAVVLCLAKRLEKDGWVDRTILYRQGATDALIDRLVELDLLEDGADAVRPDGWLDRNPSQAAIEADRAAKKEAGRRGNHAKWEHVGPFESCLRCHPKPQVVAGCETVGSGRIASDRTPTKQSESEVAIAIGPAIVSPAASHLTARANELEQRFSLIAGEGNPNHAASAGPVHVVAESNGASA